MNTFCNKLLIALITFLYFPMLLVAQFNLEAGYSFSWFEPSGINSLLSEYESHRLNPNSSLASTRTAHGLEIAGVYHIESISLGAFWAYRRDRAKMSYTSDQSETTLEESLTFANSLMGLSLQSNIDQFSIGGRLGYDFLNLKFKGNDEIADHQVKIDGGMAAQFYCSYYFRGNDRMRLLLRPFYQLNLYKRDLNQLASQLGVRSIENQRMQSFGLSLIIVNGPAHF